MGRFLRLVRIFRIVRLSRSVPELAIMLKGVSEAMRPVGSVVALLALAIYVFGILLTDLLSETEVGNDYFTDVLWSMYFLLIQVLAGFNADVIALVLKENWFCFLMIVFYWFCASLTILNMLVGVLVGVIQDVTDRETEQACLSKVKAMVCGFNNTDGVLDWELLI